MIIKYINSVGKSIELNQPNLRLKDTNFHAYEWKYNSHSQTLGIDVDSFYKTEAVFPATLCAFGSIDSRKKVFNDFFEIVEYDVVHKKTGKLYHGEYCIDCYILSGTTVPGEYYTSRNISIMAPKNVWIKQIKKEYRIGTSEAASSGLDYPHDYPYDYASARSGNATLVIDNVADNDFELVIYGPCTDPVIYVNGWPYQVYNTLSANEYIIIKSADHAVMKYLSNGTTEDLYNYRGKIQSVFTKMPSGKLSLVWSGTFGFDLTIFAERSEPKWS